MFKQGDLALDIDGRPVVVLSVGEKTIRGYKEYGRPNQLQLPDFAARAIARYSKPGGKHQYSTFFPLELIPYSEPVATELGKFSAERDALRDRHNAETQEVRERHMTFFRSVRVAG